jgi:methionine-rich copper-binding protein CopC
VLRRSSVALATAVVLVALAGVAPAGAHVELEGSDPPAGTVLAAAPASLSLTFSTAPVTVSVDVRGPDGQPVVRGPLDRRGATVVVPLPALDQPGTYTVAWQAANDEHPFTGEYTIVLDLPATTTTRAPATTTTEVAATASVPASNSESDGGGSRVAMVVISAIGVAIALAIVVAAVIRRSRGTRPPA